MIDLSQLAVAAKALGIENEFVDVPNGKVWIILDHQKLADTWDGESEEGTVAFAFRDAVRKKDRSCICCQLPSGMHEVWYGDLTGSYPEGDNETQAWANALIALHDLGVKP